MDKTIFVKSVSNRLINVKRLRGDYLNKDNNK